MCLRGQFVHTIKNGSLSLLVFKLTSLFSGVTKPKRNCFLRREEEEKKKFLGSGSKQEHSWDMFKIGQSALHLKVDINSSVDFRNYGKVR